jgi:hypothetical protein
MAHLTAAQAPAAGTFPPGLRCSAGVIMIGPALSLLVSTIVKLLARAERHARTSPLAKEDPDAVH